MIGINQFPTLAIKNRRVVEQSTNAGCFHCLNIFAVKEIKEYTDKDSTVICPHCGIDSVIGDNCGVEISQEILKKANDFWYKKH